VAPRRKDASMTGGLPSKIGRSVCVTYSFKRNDNQNTREERERLKRSARTGEISYSYVSMEHAISTVACGTW